jgi:hypothetical protein
MFSASIHLGSENALFDSALSVVMKNVFFGIRNKHVSFTRVYTSCFGGPANFRAKHERFYVTP